VEKREIIKGATEGKSECRKKRGREGEKEERGSIGGERE
jgi:hypothetical protein